MSIIKDFKEFVGKHEGCHHQEAVVGGAAHVAAELVDLGADVVAKGFDAGLFAVAAHEAVASAHQRYGNLAHVEADPLGFILQNGVQ